MICGLFQSFGFDPDTTTFVTTSSGPGVGIGDSTMWTIGPLAMKASFILREYAGEKARVGVVEKRRELNGRTKDIEGAESS